MGNWEKAVKIWRVCKYVDFIVVGAEFNHDGTSSPSCHALGSSAPRERTGRREKINTKRRLRNYHYLENKENSIYSYTVCVFFMF